MISKEEYAKLYCVDNLIERGIYALCVEKVMTRMMEDPIKTLQDLDDYGLNDAMAQNGISSAKIMNVRTGEQRTITRENTTQTTRTPLLDKLISQHIEE